MTGIKQKVQASLSMKRYSAELYARKAYETAMSFPEFKQAESEYREALKNASLFGEKNALKEASAQRNKILAGLGLTSDSFEGYYCPVCRDKGTVSGRHCKCVTDEYSAFLNSGGFNSLMTFESSRHSPQNDGIFNYCKSYAEGKAGKPDILLIGKGGTGKTYLANAMGNALAARGEEIIFYTAFDLNMTFLQIHLSNLSERFELLQSLISPKYLVVDDLGTEEQHKVTVSYLYNLLNQRIVLRKNTIITSNLHPEAILKSYGERIMSRLTDKSITFIASLSGANLRHKAHDPDAALLTE